MIRIKICGVTSIEEACTAAELGATHLGLNFYPPSPRCLSREQARAISSAVRELPSPPVLVGVFVNETPDAMKDILEEFALDLAQLSGDEPLETLNMLRPRAYKAIRLKGSESEDLPAAVRPGEIPNPQSPDLLLDTHVRGSYGGTGKTVDWSHAAAFARRYDLMLAGGLTPDNVAKAIRAVRPWGVDVASGVESEHGLKDADKMAAFIQRARIALA